MAALSFSEAASEPRLLVGERKGKTTVLIIDSDLAFAFWLGQALDLAGHNALPVRSTRAAYELIRDHRLSVDMVVINPMMPNALSCLADLRFRFPGLTVAVAIPEAGGELFAVPECEVASKKPLRLTREASLQWVALVQNLMASSYVREAHH